MRQAANLAAGVLALLLVTALGRFVVVPITPDGLEPSWDLAMYMAAGQQLLAGRGAHLYDVAAEFERHVGPGGVVVPEALPPGIPFVSLPAQAALFAPVAWLPFPFVAVAYRALSVLAVVWAMFLVRRWLPVAWPLAAIISTVNPWSVMGLSAGQDTHLAVLVWAAAARLVHACRYNGAALVLGLGMLKPHLALPGFALVGISGGWTGALLAGAAIYGVSAAVYGSLLWPIPWLAAATWVARHLSLGLSYTWLNALVAIAVAVPWLLAPRPWRGPFTLVLPIAALAFLPYQNDYYYELAALPLWMLASVALYAVSLAWDWADRGRLARRRAG